MEVWKIITPVKGPAEFILALSRAILPRTARRFFLRRTHQFNRIAALTPPLSDVSIYLSAEEAERHAACFSSLPVILSGQLADRKVSGGQNRQLLDRLSVVPLRRRVSLISTCRNEAAAIDNWLSSILAQEVYPDEIVICDAGSTDGTRQIITHWYEGLRSRPFSLKIIDAPGANIARGRNLAVQMSHGDLLLFTDAGCVLDADWVGRMVEPFARDKSLDLVMGWYRPSAAGAPASAGKAGRFAAKVIEDLINFTVPRLDRIDPRTFLPSARSMAVTRSAFNNCGGFPEYLTLAGEDSLFDYYLKSVAKSAVFVPGAEVQWIAPKTPIGCCRMLFRYARGDAEGGKLFWSHYRFLLGSFGLMALDAAAGLSLLATAVLFFDSALVKSLLLLTALSCAGSIFYRCIELARPFQPFAGARNSFEKSSRAAALALMLISQAAGFSRGLLERRRTETRRLLGASAGYMFVFGPGWCLRGGEKSAQEFVEKNLLLKHYVVYISTESEPAPQPMLHPRLEQHRSENFDLRLWLRKHRGQLRNAPTIVISAPLKNVEASKLLNSLRGRFPDAPLFELG